MSVSKEEFDPVLDVETWLDDGQKSVAFIALRGVNRRTTNLRSTTTYQVLSGDGWFHIGRQWHDDRPGGVRPHYVEPGTELTIPPGYVYYDEGDMTMLATSTPPFDPADVEPM